MKKKYLLSLSALLSAALCAPGALPASMSSVMAQQAISSADEFIETYCGIRSEVPSSQGIVVRQFTWFRQADASNAVLLAQSRSVYDALPSSIQQQILAAARAQGIDYLALAACAQALLAPAPEEDVVINPDSPYAPAPAPAAPAGNDASVPAAAQNTAPAAPVQEAGQNAASQAPAENAASQAPAENAASSPKEAKDQPASDSEDKEPQASDSEADQTDQPSEDEDQSEAKDQPGAGSTTDANPAQSEEPAGAILDIQQQVYAASDVDDASLYVLSHRVQNGAALEAPVFEPELSTETETSADGRTGQDAGSSAPEMDSAQNTQDKDIDTEPAPANPEDSKPAENKPAILPSITPGAPTVNPDTNAAQTMDPAIAPNPGKRPEGLRFEDSTEPFDAKTEQAIYALASKAGFASFEVHPVTYIYSGQDVEARTSGLIKISGNGQEILFTLGEINENGTNIQFYSDNECEVEEATGNLVLKPAGELFVELAGQSASDTPASSENEPENPKQDSSKPDEDTSARLEKDDSQAEADSKTNPGSEQSTDKAETKTDDVKNINEDDALAKSLNTGSDEVDNEVGQTAYADADAFIDQYLYSGGQLITSVNEANYKTLLGGGHSWNALDQAQRSAVNSYLAANGSSRFQSLYRQANEVRLGMGSSSGSSQTYSSNRVQTSTSTQFAGYLTAAVLAGGVLAWCAFEEKRRNKN